MNTILIANRGEIALRVIRTVQRMGYRALAVYSDADVDAPHVRAADSACRIGPALARDSYLNQAAILQRWGRLNDAVALIKKKEALCLEVGLQSDLGYCYLSWGLLAREQGDATTERNMLQAALDIFAGLRMTREQSIAAAELDKSPAA